MQTAKQNPSIALLIEQATLDTEQPLRSAMLVTLIDGIPRVLMAEQKKRAPFAKCHCCGRVFSKSAFFALPPASGGSHQFDGCGLLHYRNCTKCGSTMAIEVLPRKRGVS